MENSSSINNTGVSGYPSTRKGWVLRGLRDGFPICMGYFAVAFALGIEARRIGLSAFQSFLMSTGMVASAGEFAALMLIESHAGVFEMITTCIIVNLRYFLMSCSLSQKIKSTLVGNILPAAAVNALSVSLYGMFLAIIIPPAKQNRFIGGLVAVSMAVSWIFSILPLTKGISSGFKVIILTILLAGAAAALKPIEDDNDSEQED